MNEIIFKIFKYVHQKPDENVIQGPPNTIFFFGKCFQKTTEYLLKFLFLIESTILPINNGK